MSIKNHDVKNQLQMQIELANSNGYQTEIPQRLFIKKQPESIFTKTHFCCGGGVGECI